MQKALQSLPWVGKVQVDFGSKTAKVEVEKARFDAKQITAALEKAGYGGKVQSKDFGKDKLPTRTQKDASKKAPMKREGAEIVFRVLGMKKAKSGAT